MNLKKFELALRDMLSDDYVNSLEYAILMLNGGSELAFRARLICKIQEMLPDGCVAVSEWAPEGGRKRADIAIFKVEGESKKCLLLIELKSNFVSQVSDVRTRSREDVEKWREGGSLKFPTIFLYYVVRIEELDSPVVLKPYAVPKINKKDGWTKIDKVFEQLYKDHGLDYLDSLETKGESKIYPAGESKFQTKYYLYGFKQAVLP